MAHFRRLLGMATIAQETMKCSCSLLISSPFIPHYNFFYFCSLLFTQCGSVSPLKLMWYMVVIGSLVGLAWLGSAAPSFVSLVEGCGCMEASSSTYYDLSRRQTIVLGIIVHCLFGHGLGVIAAPPALGLRLVRTTSSLPISTLHHYNCFIFIL